MKQYGIFTSQKNGSWKRTRLWFHSKKEQIVLQIKQHTVALGFTLMFLKGCHSYTFLKHNHKLLKPVIFFLN